MIGEWSSLSITAVGVDEATGVSGTRFCETFPATGELLLGELFLKNTITN